MVELPYIEVG